MAQKSRKPEEIVAKLRKVDVSVSQGWPEADTAGSIGVTQFTCYRWRKEFDGLRADQMKPLETENERLRKAVPDLTLKKLILPEAASGNSGAPPAAVLASITSGGSSRCRTGSPVARIIHSQRLFSFPEPPLA